MEELCIVEGCERPAWARDLCATHYKRWQRHGDANITKRPTDWGDREKHSLYSVWCHLRRQYAEDMVKSWFNDFWCFVSDVEKDRPKGNEFRLKKRNPKAKFGPKNWYWKKVARQGSPEAIANARRQAQELRKDPDYDRNLYFRRVYGVDVDWYNAKFKEQEGTCGICCEPETLVIKGRVVHLAIDHHHGKGHARGLLCAKCNQGLGCFRDDTELLLKAHAYLVSYVKN